MYKERHLRIHNKSQMLFGVVRHTRQPPQGIDGFGRIRQPPQFVGNSFTIRLRLFAIVRNALYVHMFIHMYYLFMYLSHP